MDWAWLWETSPVTQLRLMAVHAHPDDESSKGAATSARYVAEGHQVMVVSCTGGERGDVLNAKAQPHVDELGLSEVRRREMARAAEILGIEHVWLGFEDSGWPEGDPKPPLPEGCFAATDLSVSVPPLVALIRRFRPHVVTTYDENGGYPHPDHVQCHVVTMAAIDAAADEAYQPGLGAPWQVLKVYYNQQFHREMLTSLNAAMLEQHGHEPYADWLTSWDDREERTITTRVPAHEYFDVRDAALLAHATQIDPDGFWFAVPRDLVKQVWPTEDFELAWSRVPVTLPEDDLFAGLRDGQHLEEIA